MLIFDDLPHLLVFVSEKMAEKILIKYSRKRGAADIALFFIAEKEVLNTVFFRTLNHVTATKNIFQLCISLDLKHTFALECIGHPEKSSHKQNFFEFSTVYGLMALH